jgi:hypothetical protein
MKRLILTLLIILGCCLPAMAQTIGTATITAQGNFTVPPGATLSLNVQLIGCNSTTPLYQSQPISITPNQTPGNSFVANGSGLVTFTVPGNDAVICGGQNYSRYALTWKINGLPIAPTQSYRFLEGQNQTLSQITPVEFVPPIIQNGFTTQCPSGFNLTGYNTQYVAQCVPIQVGALANTVTGNFTVGTNLLAQSAITKNPADPRFADFGVGTYITGATLSGGSGCVNATIQFSAPPFLGASGVQATGFVIPATGTPKAIHMNNMGAGYFGATATVSGCSVAPTVTPILATCSGNVDDPTGVAESTCAIQQAIDYAAQSFSDTTFPIPAAPAVHITSGTHLVGTNQSLRMPCGLTMYGDGPNTTVLQVPAGSPNTALTVYANNSAFGFPQNQANWSCTGGVENLAVIGSGHTSTGNGLEFINTTGYKVINARSENFGGRCIQSSGTTERIHYIGTTQINACRYSLVMGSESDKTAIDHLLINSPGRTNEGYSFNNNAISGVFPTSGLLLPNRQCAVLFNGWASHIDGGMMDGAIDQCGIQIAASAESQKIANMYFEGAGNGSINASIQVFGNMPQTASTGAVSSNQWGTFIPTTPNTFTSPNWLPSYVTDPQDVASVGGNGMFIMIACPDFAWGSSTPCAGNASITQGQYEVALAVQAGDNNLYLITRNTSDSAWFGASTAPANSAWPTGSLIQQLPGANSLGQTTLANNLFQMSIGATSPYTSGCADTDALHICGEFINGTVVNGPWANPPTPGFFGPNVYSIGSGGLKFDSTLQFSSTSEVTGGNNWVKALSNTNVTLVNQSSSDAGEYGGNLASANMRAFSTLRVVPVQYAGVTAVPSILYFTPTGTSQFTTNAVYSHDVVNFFDPVVGRNRVGTGNESFTTQYAGSKCMTDTPAGGITTTTSLSSSTSVVTVIANNSFQVNEWVTFGVISGTTSPTVNFTSTLGLLLNGTTAQITSASSTQYTFNFSNAGFGSAADVGTAAPHSSIQQCMVGGPTVGTTFDFELNGWTGTSWTLGPSFNLNLATGIWNLAMPANSNLNSINLNNSGTANFTGGIAPNFVNQQAANNTGGKCTMAAGTSCTITIAHTYTTPVCIATQQATTLTGASVGCTVSGTTVTVTSSIANSEVWGAIVFGDPN